MPGRDPAAFVQSGLTGLVYRYEALITYHAPVGEVRRRAPREFGALEPRGDGACAMRMGDDDLDWLAQRIAVPGVPFSVDGPPRSIRRALAAAARGKG